MNHKNVTDVTAQNVRGMTRRQRMRTKLIGQAHLTEVLTQLIENDKLPRLIILVGVRGSGKGQMCEWIGEKLGIDTVEHETKAEVVREVVDQAYKTSAKILHVFRDIDDMSSASKNALLKVIEEPPNGAYFIMTSKDISNQALATIRSRGTVFYMDAYTYDELIEYATHSNYSLTEDMLRKVVGVCETPTEIDMLMKCGVTDFFNFVNLVIDNIATASGSNSFRIGEKLAFKSDETDKFDLTLFLKTFMKRCSDLISEEPLKYAEGVKITSKYLQELSVASVNKQFVFDNWLLDIRQAWM